MLTAAIEYLCAAAHERRDEGIITIVEGTWAYCGCGAAVGHKWQRIPPTEIAELRVLGPTAMRQLADQGTNP